MGGSFNPPTSAHYRLMKEAVDALEADVGFFVPVSDAYLKRKMRHSHPPVVLSPEMRVGMLLAMCADDSRLRVCEKEIGTIEPRTMPTLQALQEEHPEAELYFVMGADKFDLLSSLTKKRQFLDAFKVVLYSRGDNMLEQSIKDNEVLAAYMDRIVILPQPEGTEGVSSSLVRERMLRGQSGSELLCPGVWELFKDFAPSDFPDAINVFKDEYDFLANRYPCRLHWEGHAYNNVESAFMASACKEGERLDLMKSILMAKFEQNPTLTAKLKATGDKILINGNNKKETFWGIDLYSWEGENQLGKLLMEIREKEVLK